jgi:hypothetical protein
VGFQRELIVSAALGSADDLGFDLKGFCGVDDRLGVLKRNVDFQSMPHVEDLMHFLITCFGDGLNRRENRGYGKQVILDVVYVLAEFEALG